MEDVADLSEKVWTLQVENMLSWRLSGLDQGLLGIFEGVGRLWKWTEGGKKLLSVLGVGKKGHGLCLGCVEQ